MEGTTLQILIAAGAALVSSITTGMITSGNVIYRINQLEKKVDKHNSLVERMVVVEESSKNAHHRITELREEVEKV